MNVVVRNGNAEGCYSISQARKILQGLPVDTLPGAQKYALLVAMAASGMQLKQALFMPVRETKQLSVLVWELTAEYYRAMEARYVVMDRDLAFPHLYWRDLGRMVALTSRWFAMMLKKAAEAVEVRGVDFSDGSGVISWRQTAALIAQTPGGFAAFANTLQPLREIQGRASVDWPSFL